MLSNSRQSYEGNYISQRLNECKEGAVSYRSNPELGKEQIQPIYHSYLPPIPGIENHQVYQNTGNVFNGSYVSAQDTLMSHNSVSSKATTMSIPKIDKHMTVNANSNRFSTGLEQNQELPENDFIKRQPRSPVKTCYHQDNTYSSINTSRFSIHSFEQTSVTNISTNKVVLINDMPYPVELHFPAKISDRKKSFQGRELSSSIPKNRFDSSIDNTYSQEVSSCSIIGNEIVECDTKTNNYDHPHEYDNVIQVIDSYIE